MRVLAVVPGPEHHGAVRHAEQVADLVRRQGVGLTLVRTLSPVCTVTAADKVVTWVPFTDALFGADVASAAEAFLAWASGLKGPLVVTLHDVPGSDPDPARDARRVTTYRRVAARADALAVCSAHEADRVVALLDRDATTVPLPVEPLVAAGPRPGWAARPSVGVLGFVYPGKGHDRAIDAARGTGATVVALGAPSPGSDLPKLREQARRAGVALIVTGPLSEADLHAAALSVTVPVAAYATRGASASLHTWLACGRRPVATPGPYVDELDRRWPGTVGVSTDLRASVCALLQDPSGTWLTQAPPRPDVGRAYAELFGSVARDASR